MWLIALGLVVASGAIPYLWGSSTGDILGIAGIAVGVVAFAAQEIKIRAPERKTIRFISSSRSIFSRQIFDGLQDGLREAGVFTVTEPAMQSRPSAVTNDVQLAELRAARNSSVDAVVIRPTEYTPELVSELVQLSRDKIYVICINTQPPLQRWTESGVALPAFVGSDMRKGGVVLGQCITEAARLQDASGVILIQGPSAKVSNSTRTAWAAREILSSDLTCPCVVREIQSFDKLDLLRGVAAALDQLDAKLGERAKSVVIHSGTDRAAALIASWLAAPEGEQYGDRKIVLVGYDGLLNPDGSLMVADIPNLIATVDQCPYVVGREAAEHIIACFKRKEVLRPREIFVSPSLIRLR